MNILDMLYTVVIGPLELLFRVIFTIANKFIKNYGLSIIALSFVLNILLLPLYKRADDIQAEENKIQKKLETGVKHIKKSFKGDEQYMILQEYYRQNNYKPIYALRSLSSLLLQIPFFIATYNYLSKLSSLNGQSFGPITDLGAPDGLLFGLNLLPILMTLINIINCVVYTKGQPLKSKIQLYLMALVFLVLLYNSPSALSFYYLLNNVFSLIKNALNKVKKKKVIICIPLIIVSLLGLVYVTIISPYQGYKLIACIGVFITILMVCISNLLNRKLISINLNSLDINSKYFVFATIFLCVFLGLFVPTQVINASPEEFIDSITYSSPLKYVLSSFLLALGTFVLWFNVYYYLMSSKVKNLLCIVLCSFCFVCLSNYFIFTSDLGNMSNVLVYDKEVIFTTFEYLVNILTILVITIVIFVFLWKKKGTIIKYSIITLTLVSVVISSLNIVNINNVVNDAQNRHQILSNNNSDIELKISKDGKNVIVFMLDRAISYFLPSIMAERPELKEQFSGFTYYPNTISFGSFTNFATPSLFGGYEYTPEELNKRDNELLVNKHNEALLVLPVLFSQNGYDVTVCDPPYAGYTWTPDISIYNEYPNIKAYITEGLFNADEGNLDLLNSRLFLHSITKTLPLVLFNIVYDYGDYLLKNGDYYYFDYNKSYTVLNNLVNITYITEDSKDSLLVIQNSSTHEPVYLDENYLQTEDDNKRIKEKNLIDRNNNTIKIDDKQQVTHYSVNTASFIQIGKWLDYLKNEGVYDNTRIIICSDHGRDLYLNNELVIENEDMLNYNPLLMVKDFNEKEFKINDDFMTLADITYITTKDIIQNPTNPFTNNEIIDIDKTNVSFNVFGSKEIDITRNNGNTFIPGIWYSIHDDCLDIDNWKINTDMN